MIEIFSLVPSKEKICEMKILKMNGVLDSVEIKNQEIKRLEDTKH
jgi:hypothetical protein